MVSERSCRALIVLCALIMGSVAACATPTEAPPPRPEGEQESQSDEQPSEPPPTTAPTETAELEATEVPVEPTQEPVETAVPSEPQRIEFEAEDGTTLVGLYWAPTTEPAPGVLLMHWFPGTKEDWIEIATALQAGASSDLAPGVQLEHSYAVFAFDFRGHGESGGEQAREAYVGDALTALAFFRTLPGVDPDHIAMVGASIGSDAAVDSCGEGCVTAVSLSPGSFLGVAYPDAVAALENVPVLCVAAEEDHLSPQTCRDGEAVAQAEFQVQIYSGNAHGMDMFDLIDQTPLLVDLLFGWLQEHLP